MLTIAVWLGRRWLCGPHWWVSSLALAALPILLRSLGPWSVQGETTSASMWRSFAYLSVLYGVLFGVSSAESLGPALARTPGWSRFRTEIGIVMGCGATSCVVLGALHAWLWHAPPMPVIAIAWMLAHLSALGLAVLRFGGPLVWRGALLVLLGWLLPAALADVRFLGAEALTLVLDTLPSLTETTSGFPLQRAVAILVLLVLASPLTRGATARRQSTT